MLLLRADSALDHGTFYRSGLRRAPHVLLTLHRPTPRNALVALLPIKSELRVGEPRVQAPSGHEVGARTALPDPRLTSRRRFGLGPGFIITFFYIYIGMAAVGLSVEAMITILSQRYVPLFVFALVSSCVPLRRFVA